MMKKSILVFCMSIGLLFHFALGVALGAPAANPEVETIMKKKIELISIQSKQKLAIGKALLCDEISGYGMYVPAKTNAFPSGAHTYIYIEPVNYKVLIESGTYLIDLSIGFGILDKEGNEVRKEDNTFSFKEKMLSPLLDLYMTVNFTFAGWPVGDYTIRLYVKDRQKEQVAVMDIPVTIVSPSKTALTSASDDTVKPK